MNQKTIGTKQLRICVTAITTAVPGMIIQLIFIPILIKFLVSNSEIRKSLAS